MKKQTYFPQLQIIAILGLMMMLFACSSLQRYGNHYQKHQDYASLQKVVDLLPANADTTLLQKLLGEPIDIGFDYRYLLDSAGPNDCVLGAVFHLDENGRVDQKWLDEICE